MIARIDKSGINLELDDDVVKYIDRKIGRLDRYVPRTARSSVHATVTIRDTGNQAGSKYECEVILHVPGGKNVTAKDSTMNKFAAIDIVEAKLRNQLHKYKSTYSGGKVRRGILRRVRERLFAATSEETDT